MSDIEKLRFDVPVAAARASSLREIVVETREWYMRGASWSNGTADWLRGAVGWKLQGAAREVELPVEVIGKRYCYQVREVREGDSDGGQEDGDAEGDAESEADEETRVRSQHWGGRVLRYFDVLAAED